MKGRDSSAPRTGWSLVVRVGAAANGVAVFKVSSLSGPQGIEGHLDTPPDVWAEKRGGVLPGEEPERGQLIVKQPETRDLARVQFAAIEDEHQRVVPGAVR